MTQLGTADLTGIGRAAAAQHGQEAFQHKFWPLSNSLSACNAIK